MIYALEWYDVPRWDYGYLVEYHPYLTRGDYARLEHLNSEHMASQAITFVLTSLISNRFLMNLKNKFVQKYMGQRWLRVPCTVALAGLTTYGINRVFMQQVYLNDLKELNLDKYFELDLDADMMRADLKEMGIEVEAKYFDSKHAMEVARQS